MDNQTFQFDDKKNTVLVLKVLDTIEKLLKYAIKLTVSKRTHAMTEDGFVVTDESLKPVEYHPLERVSALLNNFRKSILSEYGEDLWRESQKMNSILKVDDKDGV